ncbi:MAG: NUDIX domain-containing protein [Corynebacterium sp.]|uniref:NAD(+) diphosphatase n=1 Tax=Corynebacterium sp. TaxID=1720 RepID=UPI0026E0B3A4|nr:NUDIX domain-containing protein [Corynebacterium sp.]MDO5670830.1 NUDIX domain-containing protein [Corynebacterium sp.]
MFLPIGPAGEIAVHASGIPLRLSTPPSSPLIIQVTADLAAVRLSLPELQNLVPVGGWVADPRSFGTDRVVSRAISLLRHREHTAFNPADGAPLSFEDDGVVAVTGAGHRIFPRLDPAVIGLVELAGQERILLGRNARRNSYYSLIAGYVEHGENLEEAFAREVLEETGRRISQVRYWGSQPWAVSGSIMVGFTSLTSDEEPVGATDGELIETRWVSRAELSTLPLARPGSIAHAMITEWRDRWRKP